MPGPKTVLPGGAQGSSAALLAGPSASASARALLVLAVSTGVQPLMRPHSPEVHGCGALLSDEAPQEACGACCVGGLGLVKAGCRSDTQNSVPGPHCASKCLCLSSAPSQQLSSGRWSALPGPLHRPVYDSVPLMMSPCHGLLGP